eukprot:TRINITY_DN1391_c0_g3_i1.p1 TRINITY_DN1391_c0_g3~~TRINITY_DN1391_c0_g3_i1.p1  ORF type:complete len:418 (-),score=120.89 TRINITY_DN1391_c0_g3_i1:49-1302(-)
MDSSELYVVEMRKNLTPKVLPINPAKANDPFYRYKMRQLIVQIVGKGKMIRTSLINLDDVSRDLQIPPDYIPNFFAKYIGATAKYDPKKPERERGSISGEYDAKELSDYLKKFVKIFVLCPNCEYPEFDYIPATKNVRMKCKSCGWKGDVRHLEMDEKFKRYVCNNPPPKPVKIITKPKTVGDGGNTKPSTSNASIAKDDWAGDTSKEAVKKRMEEMVPSSLISLVASGDGSANDDLSVSLKAYAKTHNADEVVAEISRMALFTGLDAPKLIALVFDGLLADLKTIGASVNTYKPVIAQYVTGVGKDGQVLFLNKFERLYDSEADATVKTGFISKIPNLLKLLNDSDLVDDEAIFAWHKLPVKSESGIAIRKAAGPFVTWLEEAESESDEDDSGDEESEEDDKSKQDDAIEDEIDAL